MTNDTNNELGYEYDGSFERYSDDGIDDGETSSILWVFQREHLKDALNSVDESASLTCCKKGRFYKLGTNVVMMDRPNRFATAPSVIDSAPSLTTSLRNVRHSLAQIMINNPSEEVSAAGRRIVLDDAHFDQLEGGMHAQLPYCWDDGSVLAWLSNGADLHEVPECQVCGDGMEVLGLLERESE